MSEEIEQENTEIEETEVKETEVSSLDMSDEEFLNMALPEYAEEASPDVAEETSNDNDNNDTEEESEDVDENNETDDDDNAEVVDVYEDETESTDDEEEEEGDAEEEEESSSEETEENEETSEEVGAKETKEVDYKKEYNKIMAPFKANGKEMQLDNVEDVITLMSMGANYNQKMRAMKPHLKVIKMLDNNNLLDESKLSYLIDLDKKDPDAITKLIKDSGIDPLNVDIESDSQYKPNAYNVDDREVELDTVLSEIQHTSSYQETIDIISNKWDTASKRIILNEPQAIRSINDHVASGMYGQINAVVERERALGRLQGVSDLEAYKQVGADLHAQGAFNTVEPIPVATVPQPKPVNKVEQIKRSKRRKAAGGTKSAPGGKKVADFNPLSLSDEEFEKLSVNDFN